jgi:hypothetical protein
MNRRRDKALALILVMTVVLALAIIATPFVLSMILQERTGTAARYLSQADYGADGAKNYAMWRLMQSVDYVERRSGSGAASSYYYDTETEFDIRLDSDLATRVKISDPKGAIWGVTVQDEQGKLNTRSCGEPALRNLQSMVDGRVINLKDYLTLYSGRDATWIAPQKLRNVGYQNGAGSGGITVDNLHVLGRRSRVRASKPGLKPLETYVSGNSLTGGGGQNGFATDQSIAAFIGGVVEVEQRHPVNINTAKRETLTAMFEGLMLYGDPPSRVSRGAAEMLATRCVGRNFKRMEEFLTAVGSAGLNPRQKIAVVLNAVCPNAALLDGTGTVPICFKSYDVFTLEAFSSMNNPAGTEVAGRGYREVVSVSPPMDLKRMCESQYDFNQMMSQIQTALVNVEPRLAFPGYPYGNRFFSAPRRITEEADVAIGNKQAYIMVSPATDERGWPVDLQFEGMLDQWPDPHCRDHYSNEIDGKKMGGPETHSWRKFFAPNVTSEDDFAPGQRPDTGSGGFEMWAKFDGGGDVNLFDIHEDLTTNRVTLRVEGTDLVLTAADSTIPYKNPSGRSDANAFMANGVAELRWPNFRIANDTWTHFGAYWKSNRYADLAVLVDGLSDPAAKFMHYTAPGGRELMTKLSSTMSPTSTNLTLKNSGILPTGEVTPLLIGEEVVLFDGSTCLRGQRGSRNYAHPNNATVSLFGYSSRVQAGTVTVDMGGGFSITMRYDKVPATNATCSFSFNANPLAIIAGDKQDNTVTPPVWQIDTTQTQIGVTLPPGVSINDFPDKGYLRIGSEVVFYTGRSTGGVGAGMPPSSDKFTGVQRAQLGTLASNHRTGTDVSLWSVAATNSTNFPCGAGGAGNTQGTLIQIGDEWFGPVQPVVNGGVTYWVSFVNGTNPIPLRRGTLATVPSAHSTGDPVIPTFLTTDINTWPCRGFSVGGGDRVTLTDSANQKQSAQVRRVGLVGAQPGDIPGWPPNWNGPGQTQIAALYDGQNRDWSSVNDPFTRLLKFPSGELLSRPFLDQGNAQVTIGPWGGSIDELKAFASTKGRIRLRQQASEADTNLQLYQTTAPVRPLGGLVKIGDEYVGYGNWNNSPAATMTGAKRGFLNSTGEIHDQGDQIFYLQWLPVAVLTGELSATEKVIDLQEQLAGDPRRYQKGYVLIDNEMILFEWNGGGKTLTMPAKWDNQAGLYRGMFGTQPQSHSQGAMVYGMPYRTYDTYKQREFDNTMVYFQYSTKMDLAHWNWFKWTQEQTPADDKIVIHAVARVDGKGEFWDPPGMNDNVLVIDSTTPGTSVPVKRTGYQYDAGQFDVRFYVEYKQGSFDATNARSTETWKRYPKIREIQVDYDRPSQTLHHEDR